MHAPVESLRTLLLQHHESTMTCQVVISIKTVKLIRRNQRNTSVGARNLLPPTERALAKILWDAHVDSDVDYHGATKSLQVVVVVVV